ncbi:CheB methylesterase domain-containing protein [Campylobacterota bacterium]
MKKQKLILIGSSTGGPGHLEKILSQLKADFSSTIIIAQHIDSIFLPSMVKHLNDICKLDIIQAQENKSIQTGRIIFTHKKITDLHLDHTNGLHLQKSTQTSHYSPCVDSLFLSAAKLHANVDILACLLTGIGDDGAKGMLALKKSGAHCISESEESSIIYGMPKAAVELGANSEALCLDEIIERIQSF